MIPSITFKNGEFVFTCSTDKIRKEIFSSENSKFWNLNDTNLITKHAGAAFRFRQYADTVAKRVFERTLVKEYLLPPEPLPAFLDEHQVEGVEWLLTRSRSYLAHAPGAGKTWEAIVASFYIPDELPTLFIVPPTMTANWKSEIEVVSEKLGQWVSITVIPETSKQLAVKWDSNFIVCPDSMIGKSWVQLKLSRMNFKLVAYDEASRAKEPTSERTKAVFGGETRSQKYYGLIQRAKHSVLLDGSPMPNRPMELWAPTMAMAPEAIDFMSREEFGFSFCGPTQNKYGQWEFKHSHNEDALREKLQKSFMHVVPESRLNHPERLRKLILVNEDSSSYKIREFEKAHLNNIDVDSLTEESSQGELATYRAMLGESKIPFIVKYIKERFEKDDTEKILLFAWHRPVIMRLQEELKRYKPRVIMGGTDDESREETKALFQAGQVPLIIGNLLSMGRGHNLQRATRVVFGEYSWNDETNKQGEKRTSRKGNDRTSVPCDYIVLPNSLDIRILKSVMSKEERTKKIIGG